MALTRAITACALALLAPALARAEDLPPGFGAPAFPADNPPSSAAIALGRVLFFDPKLSHNGTTSCASCHDPAHAFADPRGISIGAAGEPLIRNAPSLVNAAYRAAYGWGPDPTTLLEAQIRRPFTQRAPIELATADQHDAIVARLSADPAYGDAALTMDRIVAALAAYVRSLVGGRSAFDAYVFGGDHTALSPDAKRGLALFYSPRLTCSRCHGGLLLDGPWIDAAHPRAEAAVAASVTGEGKFRVPSLRNVARTAPYLHDGRDATLDTVIDRYDRANALALTPEERTALLAFLESLTDRS